MKKVKVIKKIEEVVEVIEVTSDLRNEILVKEKGVVPGKTCTQKIITEKGKLYLITELEENNVLTGESSKLYKKQLIKVGDYIFEDINLYTKEKRCNLIPREAGAYSLDEAIKFIEDNKTSK